MVTTYLVMIGDNITRKTLGLSKEIECCAL